MRLQDYMVAATEQLAKDTFKNAKAVPQDKLDWSPLEQGRSVLNLCRELAMTPTWAFDIIGGSAEWSEETGNAQKQEQESWKSVEDCEAQFDTRMAKLADLYRSLPDEKLAETKWLPYDGGRDFTIAEMLEYPRWNLNYHLGQIAYIQTLYGDKEMH